MLHIYKAFEGFAYVSQEAKHASITSYLLLGSLAQMMIMQYMMQYYRNGSWTQHLLGLEHFRKNINDKLKKLNFPLRRRRIMSDGIFNNCITEIMKKNSIISLKS